jgi:ribosomal protein S12 methylthiotransferase accessory factor
MATDNIDVSFPGGKRVDARVGDFVVRTDQPPELGGQGSAVAPFDLFLASLATCAGTYVLGFCQARGLSIEGLAMRLAVAENDPATKLPIRIRIELRLPESFPDQLRAGIVRAAEACKVKKVIAAQPHIEVSASNAGPSMARAS